jgi:parallel beta-helix repeat protein
VLTFLILTLGSGIGTAAEVVVQPGESIQEAINNSSSGDLIVIKPGNYTENVVITKNNLIIKSDSKKPEDTIINAKNNTTDVFYVDADNIKIMGLNIKGAGIGRAGIYLTGSSNCTIDNNYLTNNVFGIHIRNSMNNSASNNIISEGSRAVTIEKSKNNTILNNNISNQRFGIYMLASEGNMLKENTANVNLAHGIVLETSNNNSLENNNASLNTINGIYLNNSSNNTFDKNVASSNSIGAYLISSNENIFWNNKILDNREYGVLLANCNGNSFSGNEISNSSKGIYLDASQSNNISGNTIISNSIGGISMISASNNVVFDNYLNNSFNIDVRNESAGNVWNTTKKAGKNIVGGSNLGGNFWAKPDGTGFSQNATDADGDGIADMAYTFSGNNIDFLPLVTKVGSGQLLQSLGDLNPSSTETSTNTSSNKTEVTKDGTEKSTNETKTYNNKAEINKEGFI